MSVATSGLKATQTWADITSRNIANATTEGYVRKGVNFSTRNGTVEVTGIQREVNTMLDRLDRGEQSKLARFSAVREGIDAYTATLGQPADGNSPSTRLNDFRQSLQLLASKPGDTAIQSAVIDEAKNLARSFRSSNDALELVRSEAVVNIQYDVADFNEILRDIAKLNQDIGSLIPGSVGIGDVQDSMGRLIDRASEIMDIQISQAADGRVNLYTASGTALIEGRTVNRVSFDRATDTISANGIDITPFRTGVRGFENGSLAGLIDLKSRIVPEFQLQLDEGARMLVESFAAADLTVPGTGLFTDAGLAYNPLTQSGLAGRLAVNDAVDPAAGGTQSRIRDGMGAIVPGAAGDATQLNAFLAIFDASQTVAPAAGIGTNMTIQTFADTMISRQQTTRTDALAEYMAISISADSIGAARRNTEGVNTDEELQKLMLIEQSYGANAKMMTTISQMIDTLLKAV